MNHQFPDPHHDEGCEKCGGFPGEPCEPPTPKHHVLMDEAIASSQIAGAQSVEGIMREFKNLYGEDAPAREQGGYDWLRTALSTYGTAHYEAGVKAERERVREWATKYEGDGERCRCGGGFCDSCRTIHDLITNLQSDNK